MQSPDHKRYMIYKYIYLFINTYINHCILFIYKTGPLLAASSGPYIGMAAGLELGHNCWSGEGMPAPDQQLWAGDGMPAPDQQLWAGDGMPAPDRQLSAGTGP